jgi:threonine/homoserine/homoserine lactone efflux protein
MLGLHDLPLFIVSGLLLNITPGPDSLLIMTRSATQGWRAGCAAAFGIGSGTLVHILAAALGLSALLAASAAAFTVVKLVGAAYLVYVGISLLRSRADSGPNSEAKAEPQSLVRIYLQGFLTNALNPKVALFFLAFMPQFISPDAANKPLAFIVLGCIFDVNGMLWCNSLAVFTALASNKIRLPGRVVLWLNRSIGGLFVSLGARLALARQG